MATPALSPQKKRMPPMDMPRHVSGTLTAEGTANAAAALGLLHKPEPVTRRTGATTGAGMLVTPAKTPQKPPNEKIKANVKSVARNLFHSDEEVTPTPRKTRTQPREPDGFYIQDVDQSFEIYTDSHERIPEVDKSAGNPFYVSQHTAAPEPPRRRSKRNTVTIPGEGKVSVDEAVRRDDGMLIVFRGKKQFRKFTDIEESGSGREGLDEGEGGLESAVESPPRRHFTRSSIKPRLLFPVAPAEASQHENSDEEAATDIEDHVLAGVEADKPETPLELVDEAPGTPEAPRYAPASPPTTARTTRFGGKKAADTTPVKPAKQPSKRSPFDSWRRVKGNASTGHKRSGEELSATASKRTRA
ncbi:hypothetical protein VTI74DRAFT_6115 [Chaetomium olivicolor]